MMTEAPHDNEPPGEQDVVGYGRPPLHSRFKPGHSGNPKGRKKGKANVATLLAEVLAQPITVTINGKRKRVSSEKAMLMRLREKALGGDLKALGMLLSLRAIHMPDATGNIAHEILSAEDRAILVSAGLIPHGETTHDPA